MLVKPPSQIANHLLASLPRKEHDRVMMHCELVDLVFGKVLCEPDRPFRYLYFPVCGFISLVTTLGPHRPLELALIGSEGMLGATQVLGVNTAPNRAVVQGSGSALRIGALQLRQALLECPRLLQTLKRYLYVLMAQLAHNIACAHFHEVEPRLARWLLMSQDRAHGADLQLTHEFLADMLGVRRSGVTIAAGALQLRKLIHYKRGRITVLDRPGLEAAACECYGASNKDYARTFVSNHHH
ncbi:MAG: Crp/Fnr family transcriptional regulator [Gammaproteobacteria bacterium]|nr:Crp/Fnr family transcriptional regulator [Gammaproteobacteria bacterium]MBU2080303.1 Crp/Fnr family transcriptional regulator [Alphaproteobacteria bacterium]MBU1489427.1 Crp/Fnr family transcriptional regulator [Gammaproteobacteria bacterium]MBU2156701.1 Crp/Fnr family transcriptional regulator [Gammaproteobacteria bacterium]MBU2253213.1 Crp/Fnr family transcriptional regulator [Gammaproteobacteria bacterium]